jgi:hypothetical protein
MLSDFCLVKKNKDLYSHSNNFNGFSFEINDTWILYINNKDQIVKTGTAKKYIIIGDLINPEKWNPEKPDLSSLKGNFYAIVWDKENIHIYNSLFSVFPVYYCKEGYAISNSIQWLQGVDHGKNTIDKTYILESLLFNYGFFNRTFYQNIRLLNANSYIEIRNDKLSIFKHTNITDYYSDNIKSVRQSKDYLADLFIDTTNTYLPQSNFNITFTSGFDGRTLVACANKTRKNFQTCSFGISGNVDVEIPRQNARQLNIPYDFYSLNEPLYIQNIYQQHSQKLNLLNPGCNGYLYPHFSYIAEQASKKADYLITGYFGSELFRALHISGAVTSELLVSLFRNSDINIKDLIYNSHRLDVLNKEEFSNEIDELANDLKNYFDNLPKNLSQNQRFYIFVFEEILRKLFGSWIYAQSQFLITRTPFLDFSFIQELLKTELAGVNNDFYTENPFKRYKGQLLYAEIIKRTDPIIYKQLTGKGYKPSSLIEPFGFIEILYPFIKKRINRKVKKVFLDNLGIISGIKNINYPEIPHYFNKTYLNNEFKFLTPNTLESKRDSLLHTLSIINSINMNSNTGIRNS